MKCPVCVEADLAMTDRQGIEIDYCPKCRGVWLDRGELDKIIERSASPTAVKPGYAGERESYRDHDRNHDYHKRKKKSSLLGELFDF